MDDDQDFDSEQEGSNRFLLSWCSEGLEYICDINELAYSDTLEALTNGKTSNRSGSLLTSLLLRARVNSHRSYEIYLVEVSKEITIEDFERYFEENPQATADLVRARGTKLYGEPRGKSVIV